MIILKHDHIITGEEYIQFNYIYIEGSASFIFPWIPIQHMVDADWKGKTIGEFEKATGMQYKYATIRPDEDCKGRKKLRSSIARVLGWSVDENNTYDDS